MKSKITLRGSKRDGYVLTVQDENGWRGDLQLEWSELKEIIRVIQAKI